MKTIQKSCSDERKGFINDPWRSRRIRKLKVLREVSFVVVLLISYSYYYVNINVCIHEVSKKDKTYWIQII